MTERINIYVPTAWDQMTPTQLAYFCQKSAKNNDTLAVQSLCLIKFSGLKITDRILPDAYEFKKGRVRFNLDADVFNDLLTRMDFLQQPCGLISPPAKIKGCLAPNNRFYGLRLDQWLVCDTFFTNYVQSHDVKYLDLMLAVLYQKQGENWDNGDHVTARSERFSKVPFYLKYWVFLWYTGVKLWLMEKYYFVFSGGTADANQTPADEVAMGVVRALNDGNLSNNETVKGSDVHEALYELDKIIEHSKTKQHV